MGACQPIGEMLLNRGKVTREQLDRALIGRAGGRKRIGEVLVDMGFAGEQDVAECLAEQFGFDIIDPSGVAPERVALDLLTGQVALSHRILPLRYSADCIECVMADPLDFPTSDMISRLAGKRAVLHLAGYSTLVEAIRKAYGLESGGPSLGTPRKTLLAVQEDRADILAQLDAIMGGPRAAAPLAAEFPIETRTTKESDRS